MLSVEFYLKKPTVKITSLNDVYLRPNEYFTRVSPDDDLLPYDKFYVEGVIAFKEGEKYVYDWRYYDLIDQLLAYYLKAIYELLTDINKVTVFSFPDQPVVVKLKMVNSQIYFTVDEDKWRLFPLLNFLDEAAQFIDALHQSFRQSNYGELMVDIDNIRGLVKSSDF